MILFDNVLTHFNIYSALYLLQSNKNSVSSPQKVTSDFVLLQFSTILERIRPSCRLAVVLLGVHLERE